MNISVYLFGVFSSGYSQYPIDYTSSIFHSFLDNAKSNTQIAIHRERDLMYYAYLRKMENGKAFGICCVLNGMMLTQVDGLFKLFETAMSMQIGRGIYVRFADDGSITTGESATASKEEYNLLANYLRSQLEKIQTSPLPPVNYSSANTSVKVFSIDDSNSDIVKSCSAYAYTYIYKAKNYDSAQTNSYKGVIARQKRLNDELQKRCEDLSSKLTKEKVKQRNTMWVGILSVIVIVFGIILWNKVLFPSEVTRYETGEFVYYGPLNSNHQPDGVGVAIYPSDDAQKRKFYIGNFVDGKRQDKEAMLLYQNGDYYYGSMNDDKWEKGVLYMKTDNSHFSGDFSDNKPYNGIWYDHKAVLQVKDGVESSKIAKQATQTSQVSRSIDSPHYTTTAANKGLRITGVDITANETKVHFSYDNSYSASGWVTIDAATYIKVNGTKYTMTKADGIPLSPNHHNFSSQNDKLSFTLVFPAIPASASQFDLIEPDDSDWKFYGIEI